MPRSRDSMAGPMRLPLFPLHVVLFPHLPLPLHIFEERYRTMTRDLLSPRNRYDGRFVVAMISDGQETGDQPRARSVGTICEVRRADQMSDGRFALLAVGVGRAALDEVDASGPYATVEATALPEVQGDQAEALLPSAQAALDRYMETVKEYVASAASVGRESTEIQDVAASLDQVLQPIKLPDDPLAASYAIGGVLQIELTRKQQLLEMPDAASRLRLEIELLAREARFLRDGALPPVATSELRYNPN